MNFSADIIVIGGGWAGFSAALEARRQGASVILIDRSPGATFLSSGAIDVAGSEIQSIERNIQELVLLEKEHPYSILSQQMGEGAFLDFLREALLKTLQSFPFPWVGDLERNRLQINSFGSLKASALVPEVMEEANVHNMNQAKILVVGIQGFAAFQSHFIKEALLDFQSLQAVPYIQFVGNFDMEVPGLEARTSLSDFEIAQSLDRENCFISFAQSLLSYLQGKVYTHVLFPPLLGVLNTTSILNTLKKITGLKIAETLGSPIQIPAFRLRNAMNQILSDAGIQKLNGEVKSVTQQDMCVQSLELESNQKIIRLQAKAFILSTGKYLGGGIVSTSHFNEKIFDAHLNIAPDKLASLLTEEDSFRLQKIWTLGLAPEISFRPIQKLDLKVYQNVFAAGSVLGGYDYIHGRCGAGVAITTGVLAGRNAMAWTKLSL